MKNKFIYTLITAFVLLSAPLIVKAVGSSDATVQITMKTSTAQAIANQEVTCIDQAPANGGPVPAPDITYVTTNALGVATWTVSVQTDHTYHCYARSALTQPDQCYYLNSPVPASPFNLTEGEVKQVSITGTSSPSTCNSNSSSSSTATSTASSSSSEAKADITLPGVFLKDGSSTTDLSALTETQLKAVKNFTVENRGVGVVEFLEDLDFSSSDAKSRLAKLDSYLKINVGALDIDTQTFPLLNASAEVTLYDLNLVPSKIKILRNGKDAESFITNLRYDKDKKSLSFEVSNFSKYEVAPNMELDSTENNNETNENKYKIAGTVGDQDSKVSIYLNDKLIKNDVEVADDGKFEYELVLEEKDNTIKITAESVSGVQENKTFNVKYNSGTNVVEDNTSKNLWILVYTLIGLFVLAIIVGFVGYKKGWFNKWLKKEKKTDTFNNSSTNIASEPRINDIPAEKLIDEESNQKVPQ